MCNIDPDCCDVAWDTECADLAGLICIDCSGDVFDIYDYSGNNPVTFFFLTGGGLPLAGGPTFTGAGWLLQPNPDSVYIMANDWAFRGVPFSILQDPVQNEAPPVRGVSTPATAGPRGSTGVR